MVLSLYLCTTLGIIFFQSLDKFGGAFEEPFLPLEDRTRPMRRCRSASIIASTSATALALRSRCDVWIIAFVQLSAKFPVRHQSGRRHARGIKHGIFRQNFANISPWHNNEQPV
jgi:hypothetical protein